MRRQPEARDFLAHLPLFEGLGAAGLERLAAGASRQRLRRGEMLFHQGERPAGLYAVVHGRIALKVRTPQGRERTGEVIGAGRCFGEAVLFLDRPALVGAAALEDSLVLRLDRDTVLAEVGLNPVFARRIIDALAAKLHAAVLELDLYALGSGDRRLAAWLLRASAPAAAGAAEVRLPASKRTIASRLNLSAEHLSRILGKLAAQGLIESDGRKVRIPDPARLREWIERPA